ncbi:heme NO-binding domain-containing protein [Granulosicoccus sp. 3-233]|uniref:heme NO-binding domain-containing protein n=1 Tax=Granulosicoccus sp. 3-233 TaxID=3417969 RepID=UPI003D34B8B4
MKGIVFNIFADLVTDNFGMEVWDKLIQDTAPASGAIYTSAEVYPDGELIAYVGALSELTGAEPADLIRTFGTYMMHKFHKLHPEYMADHTAKSFLENVHDVVHVEVKKLHPEALLPEFVYESRGDAQLTMLYSSPRKLCHLAEGLVVGTAEIFGENIELIHSECMHHGAGQCRLELDFA